MSGVTWEVGGVPGVRLHMSHDKPDVVEMIEAAALTHGLRLARVRDTGPIDPDAWASKLREEIEERVRQLVDITEDPDAVITYVQRIAYELSVKVEEAER